MFWEYTVNFYFVIYYCQKVFYMHFLRRIGHISLRGNLCQPVTRQTPFLVPMHVFDHLGTRTLNIRPTIRENNINNTLFTWVFQSIIWYNASTRIMPYCEVPDNETIIALYLGPHKLFVYKIIHRSVEVPCKTCMLSSLSQTKN